MKLSSHIFFQVKSDLDYLEEVLQKFEEMKKNWIQSKDWDQCKTALAEGFTNAVRHAHFDKPPDTIIEVEIALNPEEMIIKIWDYGKPFDLNKILEQQICTFEDLNKNEDELKPGGRGIYLLHQIADELTYKHLPDNRNCLLIKKKLFH